ncbi:MAG: flavin reductase family protein [Clostridia bacterium]|nr:flavin reductase family protein [Clostridia bacterium]
MSDNTFRAIGATTFLSPLPAVLVSCKGTEPGFDRANMITIGWTGVINSDPPMVYVSIRKERHSHAQVKQSGVFCINLTTQALCKATDYCGVKSGRDTDKFADLGLHAFYPDGFDAPALQEAPLFLCCRVKQVVELGSHDMFIANVEQVYVRDSLFKEDGSLRMSDFELISYAHGEYFALKDRPIGFFGYSVAREDIIRRRLVEPYEKKAEQKKAPNEKGRRPAVRKKRLYDGAKKGAPKA